MIVYLAIDFRGGYLVAQTPVLAPGVGDAERLDTRSRY
jgi:hypothetical protein